MNLKMEEMDMYVTKLMTEKEEKRFERDKMIYEEYSRIMEEHVGFVTLWRIAGILGPKYGLGQMGVRNAIKRMEKYWEEEKTMGEQMNKNN